MRSAQRHGRCACSAPSGWRATRREPAQRPRHAAAAVDEHRREEAHQARALRVAHGLDARVRVRVERRADRDPLRVVDRRCRARRRRRSPPSSSARARRRSGRRRRSAGAASACRARRRRARPARRGRARRRLPQPGARSARVSTSQPPPTRRSSVASRSACTTCAALLREPEVVAVERVLRAVAAADHAAAAAHAEVEVDRDRRALERVLRAHPARDLADHGLRRATRTASRSRRASRARVS